MEGKAATTIHNDSTSRPVVIEPDRTLEGHTDLALYCSVTPDGSRAVSTSHDKHPRVWDTSTGRCLSVLRGHTDMVWCCAISDDGSTVATASWDGTVVVWDASTGSRRWTLRRHGYSHAWGVTFARGGQLLISTFCGHTVSTPFRWRSEIVVVEVQHCKVISNCTLSNGKLYECAASRNGHMVFVSMRTSSEASEVRALKVATWELCGQWSCAPGHKNPAIATNAAGDRLCIVDSQQTRLCLVRKQFPSAEGNALKLLSAVPTMGNGYAPYCAMSGDGNIVVVATPQCTHVVIDTRQGSAGVVLSSLHKYLGHASGCSFSWKSPRVVTCSDDGKVRVFDMRYIMEAQPVSGGLQKLGARKKSLTWAF